MASVLGTGSRFRVDLPVELAGEDAITDKGEEDGERSYRLDAGQPECRVLVVDDEQDNLDILDRLLQSAGFQVRSVADGEQAMPAFESWRPHFIWMDVRMPGIDGVEAMRHIRAMANGGTVKIAALTASASEADRERVMSAGFDDFVSKPFRDSQIFDSMAQHLGLVYRTVSRKDKLASAAAPSAEALAALPVNLRGELRHAVKTLDTNQIKAVIGRIGEHDAVLSAALLRLADQFAYTAILKALGRDEAATV